MIPHRYWNANGYSCAIVASITEDIDWAAYIGGYDGFASEIETVKFVADRGCKLSEKEARFFFSDIKLPYRW